jgi:hypothetical protein
MVTNGDEWCASARTGRIRAAGQMGDEKCAIRHEDAGNWTKEGRPARPSTSELHSSPDRTRISGMAPDEPDCRSLISGPSPGG